MKTAAVLSFLCLFIARAASAAPFAYITNEMDDTVSVIDTATNAVVATVTAGDEPRGVAVSADRRFVVRTSSPGASRS
jgi:YVTN family beta-propeller protein